MMNAQIEIILFGPSFSARTAVYTDAGHRILVVNPFVHVTMAEFYDDIKEMN
jgi:hypothetical protein